jgi:multisubunit Na+/H+ antiporter MnhE subunit
VISALVAVLLLTAVYALMLASFDAVDLLLGAVISSVLLLAFRAYLLGRPRASGLDLPRRAVAFLPFAGAVIRDVVLGTWAVALVVLHLRPLTRPGIVAVSIGQRTPLGVAVSTLATTLSPGVFLVDVDWQQRVMLFHVLDGDDPETFRVAQQEFYDRYQRHAFP